MLRSFLFAALLSIPLFAESADWIYTARYVVTMDPERHLIENGAVRSKANAFSPPDRVPRSSSAFKRGNGWTGPRR